MEYDYNSQRPQLILKEYGRNVQKIAEHIKTIENRQKRNQLAHILTELMKQIHPNMRDNQDYANKLWDDLFIVSGFELDVDSPFPPPEKKLLGKKPKQVPYNTHELKFRHYGYNVSVMIDNACQLTDPDEREQAILMIGRLMKTFYVTWNRENVEDQTIVTDIKIMSKGQLEIDIEKVRKYDLFDSNIKEREKPTLAGEEKPKPNNNLNNRNKTHQFNRNNLKNGNNGKNMKKKNNNQNNQNNRNR
jgi:hypothetical protein